MTCGRPENIGQVAYIGLSDRTRDVGRKAARWEKRLPDTDVGPPGHAERDTQSLQAATRAAIQIVEGETKTTER